MRISRPLGYAACLLAFLLVAQPAFTQLVPMLHPAPQDAPAAVVSELDQLDLVVKMRPILPEITTGDPLRLAMHFEKKTGPVDHSDEVLGQQLLDRSATIASMDIAIKSPGGKWQLLSPQAEEGAAPRQSSLVSDGTLLLELGPEAIRSLRVGGQEEMSMPWKWDGMLKPGEYQIAVRGTLKLSTPERTVRRSGKPEEKLPATTTDVEFKTKPIKVTIARADIRNQTLEDLSAAAVEAVKKHPDVEKDDLTVQAVESIPISDAKGNRVIRVRANLPPLPPDAPRIGGGQGYWQYEVAMSPDGKPATIARWRKGFCVARGTTISTPDGDVAVEDLHSGQQVWSYDMASRSLVTSTVLAVITSQTEETIRINRRLRLSPDHPVFVSGDVDLPWKLAAELQEGDALLDSQRREMRVTSLDILSENIDVFDVAVDGPHNFFANGLLVHNKSIAWSAQAFVPWYALWNRAPIK